MDNLTKFIAKVLTYLCIIVLTALTIIIFTQVITRIMKYSLPWTDEVSRFFVVWLTFLGTSLAIHEKMHLAVNFFVKMVKEKHRKFIYFAVHVLTIGFFGILAVYGFKLTMATMASTTPTLQLPMGLFYAAIPVSAIFSIYFMLTHMFESTAEGESVV
jgi:TRAP-type C4-dicarboxylate transport system permease small subunit